MKFYIIPSPIGNLDDVTFRSINILKELDFLVVENLQITDMLLKKYKINIKKNLIFICLIYIRVQHNRQPRSEGVRK